MKTFQLFLSISALAVFGSTMAQAQATRTWVSGVGDDVNPCSRTAPCKTFAGAISKTAAGGEIDALDPAGFGSLTITKAITIDGGGGQIASVLAAGTNGFVVQAGVNDVVTIRNISIQGVSSATNGIRFLTGKALHVERCTIGGFTTGLDIESTTPGAQTFISHSIIQDNVGDGLYVVGPGTFTQVTIDETRFENNANGVRASDYSRVSIRNSAASGSSNAGFYATSNSGGSIISITNSTAANNLTGVQSGGGSAATSIRICGVTLFINTNGILIGSNGTVASFGNNYNSGSGSPNATIPAQ